MKVVINLNVLVLVFLSFSILSSCSVANKRTEMTPIAGNGWQVNTSPATLSGWRVLDIATFDNSYSQANYSCKNYKLYLNSIPEVSFSGFGLLLPIYPIYYKKNIGMSIFMKSNAYPSTMVEAVSDCPDVFSVSSTNSKLQTVSGKDNLCRYKFKHNELYGDDLKLSIQDEKNNCKIEDLSFIRKSNWSYCPFCFFNIATQPVHNYLPPDPKSTDNPTSSAVTINSHRASAKKVGAVLIGGILGGYAAYELSNCFNSSDGCDLGGLFILLFGTIGGASIGVSQVDDNTGAKVNLTYQF